MANKITLIYINTYQVWCIIFQYKTNMSKVVTARTPNISKAENFQLTSEPSRYEQISIQLQYPIGTWLAITYE